MKIPIQRKKLSNGLTLLVNDNPALPICTIMVWLRAGGRNEYPGITGISHYLEHCYSMGTQRFKPRENSWLIQRIGGTKNAFTSSDYTAYYSNVPVAHLETILDMEADRLKNLALPESNVVQEKEVIKEEKRMRYEDSPFGKMYETLYDLAYEKHPYKFPVIGTWDDLNKITRNELFDYYKKLYVPENIVLVIAGDVRFDDVFARTEKHFGDILKIENGLPSMDQEPPQQGERRKIIQKESELPAIMIAYPTVHSDHPDHIPLIFLSSVLSGGKSARLYQSLVYQKQLATFASASCHASKDASLFQFSAQAQEGHSIGDVESAIDAEVMKVQNELVSDMEFQRVKNSIKAGLIYGMETNENRAEMMGRYEILSDKYGAEYINVVLDLFERVSKDDVRGVAQNYLVHSRKNVVILDPIKKN